MPFKLFLEIASACDLRCPFCPPTARKAELLSMDGFRRGLDALGDLKPDLYFHVKGEPLLHPLLGDFLAEAEARGLGVLLTTNGTRLRERGKELLAAPALRKLSVSLHSRIDLPDEEGWWEGLFAFLDARAAAAGGGRRSGHGAAREPTTAAAAAEPRAAARRALPVSLRLWCLEDGRLPAELAPAWERLRRRWPALGDFAAARGADLGAGVGACGGAGAVAAGASRAPAGAPASVRLEPGVYLNPAPRFEWPDPAARDRGPRGTCLALRDQAAVLVDGTVVPCCLDGEGRMPLGDLRERPLREILEGPRARAMREGFRERRLVEEMCRRCGYRERFD